MAPLRFHLNNHGKKNWFYFYFQMSYHLWTTFLFLLLIILQTFSAPNFFATTPKNIPGIGKRYRLDPMVRAKRFDIQGVPLYFNIPLFSRNYRVY